MKHAQKNGFTIIELLVAVSVFVIFLAVAVGSFTQILKTQRTLSRRIALVSSVGSLIEQIGREIRTGHSFPMDSNLSASQSLTFESLVKYPSKTVTFAKSGDGIMRTDDEGGVILTPSDVVIDKIDFLTLQTSDTPGSFCGPWRITIRVRAYPKGYARPEETVNVETTVTSRVLPEDVKGDPFKCKVI